MHKSITSIILVIATSVLLVGIPVSSVNTDANIIKPLVNGVGT